MSAQAPNKRGSWKTFAENEMHKFQGIAFLFAVVVLIVGANSMWPGNTSTAHAEQKNQSGKTLVCPKCEDHMEQGNLLDHYSKGNFTQLEWAPGPPTPRISVRLKKVSTFRCKSCGYLESYAK